MPSASADHIIKKCHDVDELLQMDNKNVNTTAAHSNSSVNTKPVHYLHELPLAAETRYENLFNQLDRSGRYFSLLRYFYPWNLFFFLMSLAIFSQLAICSTY